MFQAIYSLAFLIYLLLFYLSSPTNRLIASKDLSLMACARPYLMAHYPSDVLAAAGVGLVSAVLACIIGTFLYRWIARHSPENGFCRFLIRFDVLHPTAWK